MGKGHRGRARQFPRNWFWVWRVTDEPSDRQVLAVTPEPRLARAVCCVCSLRELPETPGVMYGITIGGEELAKPIFATWADGPHQLVKDDMKDVAELARIDNMPDLTGRYLRNDTAPTPPTPSQE